jgi:hypothetical protein
VSSQWKESVSATATTASTLNIADYTSESTENESAIDLFYGGRIQLLNAVEPSWAQNHPAVVALVLVGLISQTENYFRNIISGVIKICPLAKSQSATKPVNLATAWHGSTSIEKGAFENISFSSSETISKTLKSIIGYEIKGSSQIKAPLLEFDKLCELRHAVVHSGGLLAGKNAVRLQLPNSKKASGVRLGYPELQESAEVCTALVCSSNLELFSHMSARWLHDWPRTTTYDGTNLNGAFNNIWKLFHSKTDSGNNSIRYPLSPTKARNQIVKSNAS